MMPNLVMTLTKYLAVSVFAASQTLAADGVTITRESGEGRQMVIRGDKAVFDLASGSIKVSSGSSWNDVRVDTGTDYLFLVKEAILQEDGTCRMITGRPPPFRKARTPKPDARQPENSTSSGRNVPAHTPQP